MYVCSMHACMHTYALVYACMNNKHRYTAWTFLVYEGKKHSQPKYSK